MTMAKKKATKKMNSRDRLTRRQVGQLIGMHPDSVTRVLHDGLGYAVLEWGGRGKLMYFARELVLRWHRARQCWQGAMGYPCDECSAVLQQCEALAEHMIEERHGYAECKKCTLPGKLCQPCS